jgi:2-keto-4-pentenoate hydratase/2-oxohepta-3-ene-1,7-dioic acid hydratase in catechol pathway
MDHSEFTYELLGKTQRIRPRSIYGIGRNYLKHIEELGNQKPQEPVIFLKSQASLRPFGEAESSKRPSGLNDPVLYEEGMHYEAEITVLIGRKVPLGSRACLEDIEAIGLGLDLTRRKIQDHLKSQGLPWARAKSFAGSAMVTPLCPLMAGIDLTQLQFQFAKNGEIKQQGHSHLMIFPILDLLNTLTGFTTLLPGDLIFTGTPEGVGPIKSKDSVTLKWISPWQLEFTTLF